MAIQTKMVCRNILRQIHKSTIKKKQDSKLSIVFSKIKKIQTKKVNGIHTVAIISTLKYKYIICTLYTIILVD